MPRTNGELAKFLKERRAARKLSLTDLADITELSRSYLGELETGRKGYKLPMETVAKLAEALDVSPTVIASKMGAVIDIDARQYGEHYKVLRSALRAARVAKLLEAITSTCKRAREALVDGRDPSKLLQDIEKTVKAVDRTLAYRGKPPVSVRPVADSLDDEKFQDFDLSKSG